jgi:hypothetical protein
MYFVFLTLLALNLISAYDCEGQCRNDYMLCTSSALDTAMFCNCVKYFLACEDLGNCTNASDSKWAYQDCFAENCPMCSATVIIKSDDRPYSYVRAAAAIFMFCFVCTIVACSMFFHMKRMLEMKKVEKEMQMLVPV